MVGSHGVKKVRCSDHRPRPSELCGSDKLSRLMAAGESVEDATMAAPVDFESFKSDIADALRSAASEVEEVGQEYGESFDNLPEGLQQGETGQRCEEMRDNCSDWASQIESAADEVEALEEPETKEGEEPGEVDVQAIIDAAESAISVIEA